MSDVLLDAVSVALQAAVDELEGWSTRPSARCSRCLVMTETSPRWRPGQLRSCAVGRVSGWPRVHVDRARRTIRIPAGTHLDLGATAKALAADRAVDAATGATGCGALVSLGGDISTAGQSPADGWPVRVTDWQGSDCDAEGETVAIFDGALATSSTTVRRWLRGDEVVHHLVDPTTGTSAPEVWRTVSVAAANCVDANVAATASIILGEVAPDWLESTGLPARLVRSGGEVLHLNGWGQPVASASVRVLPR